jgi:hypothetical protein
VCEAWKKGEDEIYKGEEGAVKGSSPPPPPEILRYRTEL